jgi:hypothetical protein
VQGRSLWASTRPRGENKNAAAPDTDGGVDAFDLPGTLRARIAPAAASTSVAAPVMLATRSVDLYALVVSVPEK